MCRTKLTKISFLILLVGLIIGNLNAQVSYSIDRIKSCGPYTWTNGITYNYSNWTAKDTFTNTSGNDSIVTLDLTVVQAKLLQRDTSVCKGSTVTFRTEYELFDTTGFINAGIYNGYTYYFDRTIRSWTSARENTIRAYADLAILDSLGEDNYVSSQIALKLPPSFQTLHIGMIQDTNALDYSEPDGGWRWLDGDTLSYTNWGPSEPSNTPGCVGGERWGTMWPTGKWNDNCSRAGGRALVKVKPHDISYLWSTGDTSSFIAPKIDSAQTYVITFTYNNVSCTDSLVVDLLETSSSLDITDCDSVVSVTGKIWKMSGTFQDTLTNIAGCDSIITYNITIADTTAPKALTKNITTFLDKNGYAQISFSDVNNASSDNCGIASYHLSDSLFNCSDRGDNMVRLMVIDRYGNRDSATAIVTVLDSLRSLKYSCDLSIQVSDTSFCSDYRDSISLSTTSGFNSYRWYEYSNPSVALGVDTFIKIKPSKTSTFLVVSSGDTARKTIVINPLPIFSLGVKDTLCSYDSLELNSGLAPTRIDTYNWLGNKSTTNAAYQAKYPANLFWLEVTDSNACIWRDSISLEWQIPPKLTLSADTSICPGSRANLRVEQVTVDGLLMDKYMGYSYSWFPSPSLENSIGIDNKANPIADTYYYASISDGLCIGNTDSVKVSLKPSPISFLSPDSLVVCKDDLASVQASGGTRFNWNIGGTLEAETADTEKFIKVVSDTYIVVQAIESSCQGNWDTSWIFVDTTFVSASFDVSPLTGNTIFKPTITNTSLGGERYSWDFGNGSILSVNFTEDNNRSRKYYPVYPFEGNFKVSLHTTSKNNCKDSSSVRIVVGKKFFLYIPSAFSPNGDGINDNFTITASPGVTFEGSIYNGWGEKIFDSNPLSNSSFWDGTYNNKIVQNGVYVYQITIRELDGTTHYKSGTVQVLR